MSFVAAVANSPVWCKVVKIKHARDEAEKEHGKKKDTQENAAIRASISFPPDVYKTLELIAAQKKVSLAWVVRETAEKCITDQSKAQSREQGKSNHGANFVGNVRWCRRPGPRLGASGLLA